MSFFNWFSRPARQNRSQTQHSGLEASESGRQSRNKVSGNNATAPGSRKSERLERRESLYSVVRESMTGAGLLSSSYKFKVLSLDSRGRQYLIMMDMAEPNVREAARLVDIEKRIAKIAKNRFDLLVTAVYWRVNEHLSSTMAPVEDNHEKTLPKPRRFEPLAASEVEAFKQALAGVAAAPALSAPGEIVKSGRRNPVPTKFADTELEDRQSPLSATQYGELN